jgi:hypothetical protein
MTHKVIKTDGTVEEKDGTIGLRAAQKIVGGYVEVIRAQGGFLLVDEEARVKGRTDVNQAASSLVGQMIIGNAIFLKKMGTLKGD